MRIERPKHLILEALGKFQYLSAFQLTRLIYGTQVLKYVQEHVSGLFKLGYVQRLYLPTSTPHGRPRAFYTLSQKGYSYLGDKSLPSPIRFKDSDAPYRNAMFLLHTEAANDLMILTYNLARADERITVARSKTEAQLKKEPVYIEVNHQGVGVIPDGWVEFQALKRAAIAFELDRGTVSRKDWQQKVKAYSVYVRGAYKEAFDSNNLTIATVTTSNRRVSDLLEWTEAVLNELNDQALASLMLFACFDPSSFEPKQAFYAPIWSQPFQQQHCRLLENGLFGE